MRENPSDHVQFVASAWESDGVNEKTTRCCSAVDVLMESAHRNTHTHTWNIHKHFLRTIKQDAGLVDVINTKWEVKMEHCSFCKYN